MVARLLECYPVIRWISFALFTVLLTACSLAQAYGEFRSNVYTHLTQVNTASTPSQNISATEAEGVSQPIVLAGEQQFAAAPIRQMEKGGNGWVTYHTQAGDTLQALAARFNVEPEEIKADQPLRTPGLLNPNIELFIPQRVQEQTISTLLLPDSEVVYSPSAKDFSVREYVEQAGGYLSRQQSYVSSGTTTAAEVVARVATETSFNPRLLLALLDYECHCVLGELPQESQPEYLLGITERQGLYHQLVWAAEKLSDGYYGWRSGMLTSLQLPDGSTLRIAPELNAGSVALLYYFAQLSQAKAESLTAWRQRVDSQQSFIVHYQRMFGNPWARAARVEPLFPPELTQPTLQLPIALGTVWSFTGGPHWAWEKVGPLAAIDLAPQSAKTGCVPSDEWVTAAADGVVTRAERKVVALDLDGDGFEQTGWVLLYVHVLHEGVVHVGDHLKAGDPIGHPTCEEDPLLSSGTHVHFARKYNGEWMPARDSVKMILDGWVVRAGDKPYAGSMTQGDQICTANPFSPASSFVMRPQGNKR